jgi:di/tricarboxylate transporter
LVITYLSVHLGFLFLWLLWILYKDAREKVRLNKKKKKKKKEGKGRIQAIDHMPRVFAGL